MKPRLWRRRASFAAPRVTIRAPLPWTIRLLLVAAAICLAGAAAMWAYQLGRGMAARAASTATAGATPVAPATPAALATRPAAEGGAEVAMLRAAQSELLSQVRRLETENARLKEDLEFFESVLPATSKSQGVAIQRLEAEMAAPGQLRYRMLVIRGGKARQGFSGNLQLILTGVRDGRDAMINLPGKASGDADRFRVEFDHYQRIEGVVALPEGMTVRNVQARVFEKGQFLAQQSVNM